jgi:hypothetical protein
MKREEFAWPVESSPRGHGHGPALAVATRVCADHIYPPVTSASSILLQSLVISRVTDLVVRKVRYSGGVPEKSSSSRGPAWAVECCANQIDPSVSSASAIMLQSLVITLHHLREFYFWVVWCWLSHSHAG